jgi:hypothetical protein
LHRAWHYCSPRVLQHVSATRRAQSKPSNRYVLTAPSSSYCVPVHFDGTHTGIQRAAVLPHLPQHVHAPAPSGPFTGPLVPRTLMPPRPKPYPGARPHRRVPKACAQCGPLTTSGRGPKPIGAPQGAPRLHRRMASSSPGQGSSGRDRTALRAISPYRVLTPHWICAGNSSIGALAWDGGGGQRGLRHHTRSHDPHCGFITSG